MHLTAQNLQSWAHFCSFKLTLICQVIETRGPLLSGNVRGAAHLVHFVLKVSIILVVDHLGEPDLLRSSLRQQSVTFMKTNPIELYAIRTETLLSLSTLHVITYMLHDKMFFLKSNKLNVVYGKLLNMNERFPLLLLKVNVCLVEK